MIHCSPNAFAKTNGENIVAVMKIPYVFFLMAMNISIRIFAVAKNMSKTVFVTVNIQYILIKDRQQ